MNMQAGWLDDITNWLGDQIEAVWHSFMQLCYDFLLVIVETVGDAFATAIESIPTPAFLVNGMGAMFNQLDPAVLYFVGQFRMPEGLLILSAGLSFRLLRKLFTLGQW